VFYPLLFLIIPFVLMVLSAVMFIKRDQVQLFKKVIESTAYNVFVVATWNLCVIVLMPFSPQRRIIGENMLYLNIAGLIMFILGIALAIWLFAQKRGIGAQEMDKLLTTGAYGVCRNPIYLSQLLCFFGLVFQSGAFDALLLSPILFVLYIVEAKIEEKYSIGKTFKEEYDEYRKRVPMYLKWWIFVILSAAFLSFFLMSLGFGLLVIAA